MFDALHRLLTGLDQPNRAAEGNDSAFALAVYPVITNAAVSLTLTFSQSQLGPALGRPPRVVRKPSRPAWVRW